MARGFCNFQQHLCMALSWFCLFLQAIKLGVAGDEQNDLPLAANDLRSHRCGFQLPAARFVVVKIV